MTETDRRYEVCMPGGEGFPRRTVYVDARSKRAAAVIAGWPAASRGQLSRWVFVVDDEYDE